MGRQQVHFDVIIEYKNKYSNVVNEYRNKHSKEQEWKQVLLFKSINLIPNTYDKHDYRKLMVVHKNFDIQTTDDLAKTFFGIDYFSNADKKLNICHLGELSTKLPDDVSVDTQVYVQQHLGEINFCRNMTLYDFNQFCIDKCERHTESLFNRVLNYISMYFDGSFETVDSDEAGNMLIRVLLVGVKNY